MTKYEIAANIALAGLEDFEGKMSAAQQRIVFGKAVFGRKTIKISNRGQGAVEVRYSAAYGTDEVWTEVDSAQIAKAVTNGYHLSF